MTNQAYYQHREQSSGMAVTSVESKIFNFKGSPHTCPLETT